MFVVGLEVDPRGIVVDHTRAHHRPGPRSVHPPTRGGPVAVTKVPGVASDLTLTSFDGTKIRLHWFPVPGASAAKPLPTVLKGPGWGSPGDINTKSIGYGCSARRASARCRAAGYNVLTWDPRGFGQSGGTVETDSARLRRSRRRAAHRLGRAAARRPARRPGDPRVGMVGASYGGGIQLITAAIDCRVDAIVPRSRGTRSTTSLLQGRHGEERMGDLLTSVTQGHSVDPHIPHAYEAGNTTGTSSADDRAVVPRSGSGRSRRTTSRSRRCSNRARSTRCSRSTRGSPTTGSCATTRIPTAMLWICSGHGVCLTNPGDQNAVGSAAIAWLDRYVKKRHVGAHRSRASTYVDQNGTRYTADDYPAPRGCARHGDRHRHAAPRRRWGFRTRASSRRQHGPARRRRGRDHAGQGDATR